MTEGNRLDPKSDPRRRCMKPGAWPEADSAAWTAARAKGDLLEGGGLAAEWRPNMVQTVEAAYGRFLTLLTLNGWLDPGAGPAGRLTEDRLRAYIAELRAQVSSVTVRNRVRDLAEALRVMAPEVEFPYLRRARARLNARARPSRNKRRQIVPVRDLFNLGLDLIREAEEGDIPRELWRACRYRDGLMIMLLACRPIRRETLATMRIGEHLVRRGDEYMIALDETETKNHRRYDRPLHPALTPYIERYLAHHRPQLLGERDDDRLWISWRSLPLSGAVAHDCIVALTRAAFGVGVPPHRFRDSAVTSMGEEAPELVWLAPSLLHHADHRIAEKHYNLARDAQAVADWQDHVREWRRAARAGARGRRTG